MPDTTPIHGWSAAETVTAIGRAVSVRSGEFTQAGLIMAMRRYGYTHDNIVAGLADMRNEGLIAYDCRGHIGWIHSPALYNEYIGRDDLRID